jgi:hypothetical protein
MSSGKVGFVSRSRISPKRAHRSRRARSPLVKINAARESASRDEKRVRETPTQRRNFSVYRRLWGPESLTSSVVRRAHRRVASGSSKRRRAEHLGGRKPEGTVRGKSSNAQAIYSRSRLGDARGALPGVLGACPASARLRLDRWGHCGARRKRALGLSHAAEQAHRRELETGDQATEGR